VADGLDCDVLPDLGRLATAVVERAGWKLRDFIAFRACVPYPPMPSSVVMRYRLPTRPQAGA
jgi:hypothetical protein